MAERLPEWRSTILRQIASPSPVPSIILPVKASKHFLPFSGIESDPIVTNLDFAPAFCVAGLPVAVLRVVECDDGDADVRRNTMTMELERVGKEVLKELLELDWICLHIRQCSLNRESCGGLCDPRLKARKNIPPNLGQAYFLKEAAPALDPGEAEEAVE